MTKTAILLGSARADGNTAALVDHAANLLPASCYSLQDYKVMPFEYGGGQADDFDMLIDTLLQYDRIAFATPMYWYSASAQMKAFLDRLTELLSLNKSKGRQLRTKECFLLATGATDQPANCFEDMFRLSFQYLGMRYLGMLYCDCSQGFNPQAHHIIIEKFCENILYETA